MRNLSRMCMAIALLGGLAVTGLYAQDANEIVRKSRNRISYASKSTRSRMVILDKAGNATERIVDQYTVEKAGETKKMFVFQKPASVANTRFLTVTSADKTENRWIFLPALGKIRRISSGEGSGSFLGTDLSYDDISATDRNPDLDTHVLIKEETVNGKNCYVVESKPMDPGYQYSRMVSWIEKETLLTIRGEFFDNKGALSKVMEMLSAKSQQDRLTPVEVKMSTVSAGTSTTIFTDIVKYDEAIPDGVFTQKFLETGRP